MARGSCASRWWRTNSASVRPRAMSAASLNPRRNTFTTSSRSPPGANFMVTPLKVGVAGLGTVGAALIAQVVRQREALAARCGRAIEIAAVCARARGKDRGIDLKKTKWYSDPMALARAPGIDVFVELIGGAIPIVKTLREGMAGNSFERIYGILNGTCNYILTRMEQDKLPFAECLKEAQRLGYAEADPSFDIEGHDTAQKLSLIHI